MANESSLQDKVLPVMVVALIGAAFALGMMWGKVQVYEKGGVAGANVQAQPGQEIPTEEEIQLNEEDQASLLVDPAYAFGDENAPVTLVEFTDYECPFCQRYINDTSGTLISDYVDTGKVRYVIRDLPLSFHPSAQPAALAARCAGDQGKYLEMHDLLFDNQEEWTQGDVNEVVASYASQLGLNTSEFSGCMESEKYADAIQSDVDLGAQFGATGTPSFFINGKLLVGAQPTQVFVDAIEEALNN